MRLICPGCGAQYEVDDGIIPDAGRDVQCSACGHVWFQKSRPMLLSGDEVVTLLLDTGAEQPRPPLSSSDAVDQVMTSAFDEDPDPELPDPGAQPLRPRRALDDSLLSILREEAEREARARRAESPALETQEEMNLAEVPQVSVPPAAPVMAEPAAPEAEAPEPAPPPALRIVQAAAPIVVAPEPEPEPLPDIGTLKASLRASADRHGDAAATIAPVAPPHSGFRTGFLSVLTLAGLATAAYGFAPELSGALPDLDPALTAYVAQVDSGRIWLDEHLRDAISVVQKALRG
ncbi:MAG TPA: zinc-ribbon domain-containing protein [Paenirhodobacter sp.]